MYTLVDFSEYTPVLLKAASNWADANGAHVFLVHRVEVALPALADLQSRESVLTEAQKHAERKMRELAAEYISKSVVVNYLTTQLPLTDFFNSMPINPQIDMVLAGLKGAGILKQIFLGTTTARLIEEVNAPLIALPRDANLASHDKLFVGAHYASPINQESFSRVLSFFPKVKKLDFITVFTPADDPDKAHDYLENLAEAYKQDYETALCEFEGRDAFKELKTKLAGVDYGFLVIQKGSRTLTDRLFRRFMVNDLVFDGSIPLIVLP